MEIRFTANDIIHQISDENSFLIGFADDSNEPNEYVIAERAFEFDEQDIELGMDTYYFEYADQSNSGYGLCDKVIMRRNEISFVLSRKLMENITVITVEYNEDLINDMTEYRKMLSNVFGNILVVE
ncbi:Imm10 family immunity protein [Phocaeicola sartorii]|uniref:Imm10 family immunity protein n=1 Tax=Phocaeicola sartorii TaxID=671267 RepID=UPI002557F72C|nr:Imm10 family immunity protein [Phocaeicola sartorii]